MKKKIFRFLPLEIKKYAAATTKIVALMKTIISSLFFVLFVTATVI